MKKALITVLALTGTTFAEDSITLLPQLNVIMDLSTSEINDSEWIGGKDKSVVETLISADAIANNITSSWGQSMQTTGWYGATDNLHTGTTLNFDVEDEGKSFSFTERGAYGGTFVVASVSIADLLNGNEGSAQSFTLSFNAESSTLNFSAWSWNGTTATAIISDSVVKTGKNLNTFEDVIIPDDAKNLLFFFHGTGYGTTASVSNLTSSVELNLVPEPTTATLSLFALAGLAARRRRK